MCRHRSRNIAYNFSFLYSGIVLKISNCVQFLFLDFDEIIIFWIKINSTHMIRWVRKSTFINGMYIPAVLLNMIEFNNWHWLLTIVNDWWIETNKSDPSFPFVNLSTKGADLHNPLGGFNQWIQFSENEHANNKVSLSVDWIEMKTW